MVKIVTEVDTKDIKTFRLAFLNKEDEEHFKYMPGQFAELSIFGKGESPIGIASSPTQPGYLEFTVQKAGVVTSALHEMEDGSADGCPGASGQFLADRLPGREEHRDRRRRLRLHDAPVADQLHDLRARTGHASARSPSSTARGTRGF